MRTVAMLIFCCVIAAAQDYTISGVVVDHLNHQALNHVLVEIIQPGKGGEEASVLTEADGKFTFLHVPMGKYRLMAQKRGQPPQAFGATEAGFGTAIVVDGTAKTEGIVFPLRTDSLITGMISNEEGEPVRSAQVSLFRQGVLNGEAQTVRAGGTNTNSAGQFHFGHLQRGKYYLAVSARVWFSVPGAETVYPVTFYGDTTDGSAASPIVLKEGDRVDAPIMVRSVPGIRVKLPASYFNRNVRLAVAGPGGTQVIVPATMTRGMADGSTIRAMRDEVFADPLTRGRPRQSQPGATGRELSNLAAGRYQVLTTSEDGPQEQTTQTVELVNGGSLPLDDSVAEASVTGRMIFETSRPAGELNVRLNAGRHNIPVPVAADGTFKFGKIAAGSYNVFQDSAELRINLVEAKGGRVVRDRLEVTAGASVEVTVHVEPVGALGTVKGVAIQNGKGVAGVMVLLLPKDLSRVRMIRRGQSDADGSFAVLNVQPGSYTVVAIDDGEDLAYRDEKVIKPFVAGGVAIDVSSKSSDAIQVAVQTRIP